VDVEHVSVASIRGRNNVGLAVGDETNMAEEAFVENLVDGVAVISSAVRLADNAGAGRGSA
jgi:hypothetical protein